MDASPVPVKTRSRLRVTYSIHRAAKPVSAGLVVMQPGICHTRAHYLPLAGELNQLGLHVAIVDQQSERACFRNCIGLRSYIRGMKDAVEQMESETKLPIGAYVLHSMGALIGETMQQRYADLRRPTVFLAPIPVPGALPITLRLLRRRPGDYFRALLRRDILSLASSPQHARKLFFNARTPAPIVEHAQEQLKHAPLWVYCQLVLRRLFRRRIRNDGGRKLLLYSKTDKIFYQAEYEQTRARYPQLEDALVKGGHDFFLQHAEQTAQHIAKFLPEPSGTVARPKYLDLPAEKAQAKAVK